MGKRCFYVCDKCEKEIETPIARIQIQLPQVIDGYKQYRTEDRYDFCDECIKKVMTFIMNKE